MLDDEMRGRISLQSFSSIPRKLGHGHLHFLFLVKSTHDMAQRQARGAAARAEIPALQLSKILAVVVDVAIFLPWHQVHASAPPHLLSTVSRCFCVASAVFSCPRRRVTCIVSCVDLPCRRRASCRSESLGAGGLCIGVCLL